MDLNGKQLDLLYEMIHSLGKSNKLKSIEQDQFSII